MFRTRARSLLSVLAFLLFASGFVACLPKARANFWHYVYPGAIQQALAGAYDYHWGSPLIAVGDYLRKNTPPDSVIIYNRKELYLYSQRRVITSNPQFLIFSNELDWQIFTTGADYIVTNEFMGKTLIDTKIKASPYFDFQEEYRADNLVVFKIKDKLKPDFTPDDYESVLSALRAAVAAVPDDYLAQNNLGVFLLKAGQAEEALTVMRRAWELNHEDVEILFNLASACQDNGLLDEAESLFYQALRIQFVHQFIPLIQSNLRVIQLWRAALAPAAPDSARVDFFNQIAIIYFQRGKFAKAEDFLRRARDFDSGSALTITGFGRLAEAKGEYPEASRFYQRAIALSPDDPNLSALLSRVDLRQALLGTSTALVDILGEKVTVDPSSAKSYNYLGSLYLRSGDFLQALLFFRRSTELDKDYAPAWENLGYVYQFFGNQEKARQSFEQAKILAPERNFIQPD